MDSYQVRERLGEGGTGQVYRADGPDGPVALKVLAPAADLDPAARARFAREATALAALRHPALVRLLDHGIDDELGPYLVLPLLSGPTLRALVAGAAVPPEAAVLLATPIVQAVAALHGAGYVHRDLKPDNAIIGPDGRVTVIDLGLAWHDGMSRLTETGTAVGSVGYMAPEQIEGGPVAAAVDVWAVGVMLYEWIAGRRPFARARVGEEAAATLVGSFPALSTVARTVDDELAALIGRCLAIDPATRPTAAALGSALTSWLVAAGLSDGDGERAALVDDVAGYAKRIAPRRALAAARIARAALAAGEPFAALAACDRGLAYAAEDRELLALVREAEAATRVSTTAPTIAPTTAAALAPTIAPTAAPTIAPSMARRRRVIVGLAIGAALLGLLFAGRQLDTPRPRFTWTPPPPTGTGTATAGSAADGEMARDVLGLVGKLIDASEQQRIAATAEPTTARGWFERSRREPPTDAVVSLRRALVLAPEWPEAMRDLCVRLVQTKARDAIAGCERALALAPADADLRGALGGARLLAGDLDGAIDDFTQVIASHDAAVWRIGRGKAYRKAGRGAAARADFQRACELGDRDACGLTAP